MSVVQYINKFEEIYLVVVRKMWLTPICLYFLSLFLAKTSSPSPEVLNSITCLKAHHLRHPTSVVSWWMGELTENTEQTANSHHESSPFPFGRRSFLLCFFQSQGVFPRRCISNETGAHHRFSPRSEGLLLDELVEQDVTNEIQKIMLWYDL